MNEGNGSGKGLFYGVIGVATLIVAIIGATFAWFTATAGSDDDRTLVTTGTLTITYTDGDTLVADNLKPATAAQVSAAYAAGDCVHVADAGADPAITDEQVCSVYQFTVTNTGTLTANLTGALSSFAVNGAKNPRTEGLETAVTTAEETTNGYFKYAVTSTAPGNAVTLTGSALASATALNPSTTTLAPSGTVTNYIVVWLDSAAGNSYQEVKASATYTINAAQTNYTP
ncbi:MAG: hypothetical protein Q4G04_05960 [bacterium]|nr:hypothetical protein [bacterium]